MQNPRSKTYTASEYMEMIARECSTVESKKELSPFTNFPKLYNEYGTQLGKDEVRAAVAKVLDAEGLTSVGKGNLEMLIYDEVKKRLNEEKESRENRLKEARRRRFDWSVRTLLATVALQAGGLMATIWEGDWRWTLSAFPLVAVDIAALIYANANYDTARSRDRYY